MGRRKAGDRGSVWVWVLLLLVAAAVGVGYQFTDYPTIANDEMAPTLRRGDRLFACRPQVCGPAERGDIVLFSAPEDAGVEPGTLLLRRVIGLPGDTVEVKNGVVLINGEALKSSEAGTLNLRRDVDQLKAAPVSLKIFKESAGKHNYRVASELEQKATGNRPLEKLETEYFLMADQRTFVKDSRDYGPISKFRIKSKVLRVLDVSNSEPERVGALP